MKIAIDVSAAGQPQGMGFVLPLAHQIVACTPPGNDVTLFWAFRPGRPAPPVADLSPPARLKGWPIPGRILGPLWKAGCPPSADLLGGHPDVFHATTFAAPTVRRTALVQTVHDLAFLRCPDWAESMTSAKDLACLYRRARMLAADSAFTAAEIRALLPGPLPPVRILPLGVDATRFRAPSPEGIQATLATFSLKPGYLLSVSTLHPRKNPLGLLQAWRLLPASARPPLLWIGKPGWKDAAIRKAFRDAVREGLRWLTDVSGDHLPAFYAGASAFCYPSLYEGFGLPILEAMACGTPVVTSDRGAMKEVAGDAALLADPESPEALSAALLRVLTDSDLREGLKAKGLARAEAFSWEASARKAWEIYHEAAG